MWLLDTTSLELRDFVGASIPPYAILSHTWGSDEVTFQDVRKARKAMRRKAGYPKVQKCCEKARQDGHQYVWIDTCCIDKRSSAELSEAINSMYRWYEDAQVCYAYLADVPSEGFSSDVVDEEALKKSRWFTRGWTLQELIAPRYIQFLGQDWRVIGTKALWLAEDGQEPPAIALQNKLFVEKLAGITGIQQEILWNSLPIGLTAVAQKMAWAARRQTTREEDLAYALMGLFGVSMPILYGEGLKKAFRRLQLEIIQKSPDQSIFVWRAEREYSGLLAESPHDFADSGLQFVWKTSTLQPYSMTNLGLFLNQPALEGRKQSYILALRCCRSNFFNIYL
jgi:hypothetical protein